MIFNESFWVAISIILFVTFIFKYIKQPINNVLGNRISSIKNKLDESLSLKKEAETLLKQQQQLIKESAIEIEKAKRTLDEEIKLLKQNAEKTLKDKIAIKQTSILSKIETNEKKLVNQLRMQSVKLAINASLTVLHEHNFSKTNNKLIDDSLDLITKNFAIK